MASSTSSSSSSLHAFLLSMASRLPSAALSTTPGHPRSVPGYQHAQGYAQVEDAAALLPATEAAALADGWTSLLEARCPVVAKRVVRAATRGETERAARVLRDWAQHDVLDWQQWMELAEQGRVDVLLAAVGAVPPKAAAPAKQGALVDEDGCDPGEAEKWRQVDRRERARGKAGLLAPEDPFTVMPEAEMDRQLGFGAPLGDWDRVAARVRSVAEEQRDSHLFPYGPSETDAAALAARFAQLARELVPLPGDGKFVDYTMAQVGSTLAWAIAQLGLQPALRKPWPRLEEAKSAGKSAGEFVAELLALMRASGWAEWGCLMVEGLLATGPDGKEHPSLADFERWAESVRAVLEKLP